MVKKISNLIVDIARKEDLILRRIGKGILFIPELSFTYLVGRQIALNTESIFGTNNVLWKPETSISADSGRIDLVFDVQGGAGIAIEFKIGGKSDSYIRDINKLKAIPGDYEKIFCALIDAWPENLYSDGRIQAVESQQGVYRVCRDKFFDFFSTLHDSYKSQLCCIVGVWHVRNNR